MQGTPPPSFDTPPALRRSLCGDAAPALLKRLAGPPGLAAFDADGTLWDGDLGEAVLQALIARGELVSPPPDPWGEYVRRVRRDPHEGFAYAGRLMAGLSERRVRELSGVLYADRFAPAVFAEARWLLAFLHEHGWDVYLVSASNRWSIEVAAEALGVAQGRVCALDLDVAQGVITDRVRLPVPTLDGKPALLRTAAGRAPDLAFGNSVLDLPLLRAAVLPVAVGLLRSVGRPRNQFLVQAARRGWARIEIPAAP